MLLFKKIILMTYVILGVTVVTAQNNSDEKGVEINGVKWATRNVGAPGKFVASPENYGNLYTLDEAERVCPAGWRLPTQEEIQSLVEARGEQTTINDVRGYTFGSGDNVIFLPSAGSSIFTNIPDGGLNFIGLYLSNNTSHVLSIITSLKDSEVFTDLAVDRKSKGSVRCVAE